MLFWFCTCILGLGDVNVTLLKSKVPVISNDGIIRFLKLVKLDTFKLVTELFPEADLPSAYMHSCFHRERRASKEHHIFRAE